MKLEHAQKLSEHNSGIYQIRCITNNKVYVGSSINLNQRKRSHFKSLERNAHKNRHLQCAFNKYGINNFCFEILELVGNKENLVKREQFWINATKCFNREIGFNINLDATSSLGVKRTDEFKEKIRLHNLNRDEETKQRVIDAVKKANTGRVGWNRGLKMWQGKQHPRGGLGKKYPNRILTKEGYEKRCIANRRDRGEKFRKLIGFLHSKTHYFISPSGEQIKIFNLKKFSIENKLNQGHMNQVSIGNEKSHKGWKKWQKNLQYNGQMQLGT